jgi:hypothetical protein
MNTIVLVVHKPDNMETETRQIFIDDVAGAVSELDYWNKLGKHVEVLQYTESSDYPQ